MSNKTFNTRDLAMFFAQNEEKDNIISAIFNHFRLDCLERCNINPSQLDELIRKFCQSETCDVEIITSIIDMIRMGQEISSNKEKELVKSIESYVAEHCLEDISIEQIAEQLNISYYYMCHIFKNNYGISVNTFRTQKRLEIAMRKLIETDEKITDIAVLSGFNNISYFTETFTKMVGISPTLFREKNKNIPLHKFYSFDDIIFATNLPNDTFIDENIEEINLKTEMISVSMPDEKFGFLHEAAIIKYHGVLYASWYNCPKNELIGFTPICEKRSYDDGKTWTELEIVCEDRTGKILYCPPVYGICDDKLYMLVNQMVAPDHIHSLDLYVLNNQTDKFELLWSRPIPFKLNTNVVTLPNGKLMLPGRIGELDGFPITPAVLISDSGKIDAEWRLVKIAENGDLPNGKKLVHPEISVMWVEDTLYMFNRNDAYKVPLVYSSKDFGETWSDVHTLDVPYISCKIYAGNLSDGRNYLIANIDEFDRSRLAIYLTDKNSKMFNKKIVLFDGKTTNIKNANSCHYPCAYESDNKLYIIATVSYNWITRGAGLFVLDLNEI